MHPAVREFGYRLARHAPLLLNLNGVEWTVSDGLIAYEDAVDSMEARVANISAGTASEQVWLLEHPALYTAGTSAKVSDLLTGTRFPVHASGRGGQYTYHGPGQLVVYTMFDLNSRGRDVRYFVNALEDWIISTLADCGISGSRRVGFPGVWVAAGDVDNGHGLDKKEVAFAKIAAIGVRVRRWVTFHGFAVNVCPDLSHFEGIVPCGIADAGVTSIRDCKPRP